MLPDVLIDGATNYAQQFISIKDSVSLTYGNGSGTDICTFRSGNLSLINITALKPLPSTYVATNLSSNKIFYQLN